MSRDHAIRNVQEKSFLAHELLLYLDTHPEDRRAFREYQRALEERREAVCAYEREVRSLTPDGLENRPDFDWVDEPLPVAVREEQKQDVDL